MRPSLSPLLLSTYTAFLEQSATLETSRRALHEATTKLAAAQRRATKLAGINKALLGAIAAAETRFGIPIDVASLVGAAALAELAAEEAGAQSARSQSHSVASAPASGEAPYGRPHADATASASEPAVVGAPPAPAWALPLAPPAYHHPSSPPGVTAAYYPPPVPTAAAPSLHYFGHASEPASASELPPPPAPSPPAAGDASGATAAAARLARIAAMRGSPVAPAAT